METIIKSHTRLSYAAAKSAGLLLFVFLTASGAFIRIPLPFTPVPITLQTFFVLLAGAFLGSSSGAVSQVLYILLGLSGISIFTFTGAGLPYFFGPTGGYLMGFVAAAFLVGRIIPLTRNKFLAVAGVFFVADLLILSSGVMWLNILLGYRIWDALRIGFIPFIPGDSIKLLVAALCYTRVTAILKPRV
jgi:biotin transport system substrate-specific component